MDYEKMFRCFCITAAVIYLLYIAHKYLQYWRQCKHEEALMTYRKQEDVDAYKERIDKEKDFANARFRHEERMKVIEKTGIIPREIESYFDSPTQATVPATT